jgi:hypothetical protein
MAPWLVVAVNRNNKFGCTFESNASPAEAGRFLAAQGISACIEPEDLLLCLQSLSQS